MASIKELINGSLKRLQDSVEQFLIKYNSNIPSGITFQLLAKHPNLEIMISNFIDQDPILSFVFNKFPQKSRKTRIKTKKCRILGDDFLFSAFDVLDKLTKTNSFLKSIVTYFFIGDLHRDYLRKKRNSDKTLQNVQNGNNEEKAKKSQKKREHIIAHLQGNENTQQYEVQTQKYEKLFSLINDFGSSKMMSIDLSRSFLKNFNKYEMNCGTFGSLNCELNLREIDIHII